MSEAAGDTRPRHPRLDPDNPFARPAPPPHGLPDFDRIRPEHYLPAFEAGFAEQLAEVETIAAQAEAPTFQNTIEALERSGQLLRRVARVFDNLRAAASTPELERLEGVLAPRLAAHEDAVRLHPGLFARIRMLAERAEELELDAEQRHLLERHETAFRLRGAGLDEAGKAELTALNRRLAELSSAFGQQLLADTEELALRLSDRAELDGLGEGEVSAAARAAAERGLDGWLLPLSLFTAQPALASLHRREVRERLWRASRQRASRDNGNDNRPLVLEIARLRARRAELLGFPHHAAVVAAESTAGSAEAVAERLAMLAGPAARNAAAEQERLQLLFDELRRAEGLEPAPMEPWDQPYLLERLRAREHAVDAAALRPFFEAERVLRDGVFFAAERLYGLRFAEREELPGYLPDVRVFEVRNEDGSLQGLFLLDLYTRPGKRGGAWMNALSQQNRLLGEPTVVVNNLNVARPEPGAPTLLSLAEAKTLFHEFGHALHGLLAEVEYPSAGGTNVPRDFVEFPSQLNEMWMLHPQVLPRYARHHDSGEPLDEALARRLREAGSFGEGFASCEYLAAAVLDQAWHTLSARQAEEVEDVAAFERAALERAGLADPLVPPRYSSCFFAHCFSGDYGAGYYSYIWSEVLDADAEEWFQEHGGLRRASGQRFRERLLGVGGSRDPVAAYRDFRGRDARIEPLLTRRRLAA
ncbi:MAG: M3 family metallopeptidase [Pseudoclavibacter sp.]|nr:M3 family metallopeptidase [Pseudoclavibacter sp.]